MSSEPVEPLDESPFDEDDEPGGDYHPPWEAARPLTQKELDYYAGLPWDARVYNPWKCMFNRNAEDGVGYYTGVGTNQCDVLLADPTKSRYCIDHARQMGVDYYSPSELSAATDGEAATNLTRLVPKAVKVLEKVMDDEDAPHGVRAKAADSILDRTGYAKGVDVRVDARVATVDITGVIRDRLDALKDSMVAVDEAAAAAGAATVAGAIIAEHGAGTGGGSGDGAGADRGSGDGDPADDSPAGA